VQLFDIINIICDKYYIIIFDIMTKLAWLHVSILSHVKYLPIASCAWSIFGFPVAGISFWNCSEETADCTLNSVII